MSSARACLLLLPMLIFLCCTTPVMGGGAEQISFFDVYADVNGAAVYFDNEYMGDISNGVLTVRVVSTKSRPYYHVTVKKENYQTVTEDLPKVGGELQHIPLFMTLIPLVPKTGNISVSSSPTRAVFILDGTEQGVTPQTITNVTPGTYSVRLVSPGYETWSGTAVVSAEDTCKIDGYLKKKRAFGTLSINSDPAGAEIYLDGWYYGTTPMTVGGISADSHIIEIKMDGYTNIIKSVIIRDNTVTPVSFFLCSTEEQVDVPGTLSVRSSPAGAMVYIDSVSQGVTPVTVTDLTPDVHQMKLTAVGYQDYQSSIVLSSGERRTLDIALQPLPSPEFAPSSFFVAMVSLFIVAQFVTCRCYRNKK